MDIQELIDRLEEIRDHLENKDIEIKAVFQPNYPLIADVLTITTITSDDSAPVIYIGIGDGKEYGSDIYYADEIITDEEAIEEEN